jgi:hypothetical protein
VTGQSLRGGSGFHADHSSFNMDGHFFPDTLIVAVAGIPCHHCRPRNGVVRPMYSSSLELCFHWTTKLFCWWLHCTAHYASVPW